MFRDALAGFSVAGLLLPSAIAYAAIAGLSPEHAIIATIIGLGVYALAGRSRFAMVAPTSSSAAILAALILSMQGSGLQTAALILVTGVIVSSLVDLSALHVALVGKLAIVLPRPSLPELSLDNWTRVLELAVPLFLILFAESWSSIRGLALRHGDPVAVNRELLALGFANTVSGLFQGMPVGAGFSASSAAEAAGARTRLAGLAAMAVLLLLAIWGRGLVALLPSPVLATVVIASLFHALNPAPLLRLWRIRQDQYVATAAVVAVILLGVLDGMLAAIGLSLLALLQRLAGTRVTKLGRIAGTHDFVSLSRYQDAETDPEILILRPAEPLFFANAERVLSSIATQAEADTAVKIVILSLEDSPELDSTALDALLEFDTKLHKLGRRLLLARIRERIRDTLRIIGDNDLASDERSFHSVADAFTAAQKRPA